MATKGSTDTNKLMKSKKVTATVKKTVTKKNPLKVSKSTPKIQIYVSPVNDENVEGDGNKTKAVTVEVKANALSVKDVSRDNVNKSNDSGIKTAKASKKKVATKSRNSDAATEKENRPPESEAIKSKNTIRKAGRLGGGQKRTSNVAPPKLRVSKAGGKAESFDKKKTTVKSKNKARPKESQQNGAPEAEESVLNPVENLKEKPTAASPSPNAIKRNFQTDRDIAVLESIFPNIDPTFLKRQYVKMKRSVEDTVNLISVKKSEGETPARANQLRKSDVEKIQAKYTTNFNVEEYLKAIPDPWNYFLNTELHNSIRYADLSLNYLKKKFPKHYVHTIQDTLINCEYSLYRANKELSSKKKNHLFKKRLTTRGKNENNGGEPTQVDFQFMQEVALIEHEDDIIDALKKMELKKFRKFKSVLKNGGLLKCQTCTNVNLVWDNITYCPACHVICKDCINQHIQTEISNGNFDFKCPLFCNEPLELNTIQDLLKPEITAVIVRKRQLDELKLAGIDDFDYCPVCYYMKMMPPPDQKLFYCLNPTCMKIFCSKCRREEHEPYECEEVKDVETFEMKFQPLSSICFQCKKEFVKEENSNRMVCSCGSVMCYTCHQPYPDCPHFKMASRHGEVNKSEFLESKMVGEENNNVGDDYDYDYDVDVAFGDDKNFGNFVLEKRPVRNLNFRNDSNPNPKNPLETSSVFPDFVSSDSDAF